MATKKKRLTISLDENHHEVIERLAKLQKRPKSAVITEVVETIIPPLMRTVAILEAARDAPEEDKNGLRKVVEDVEQELNQTAGDSLSQMDWLRSKLEGEKDDAEDAA